LCCLLNSAKLSAGAEFHWAILAEFEWKATATTPLNQMSKDSKSPHLITQVNMEITLTKHKNPARNEKLESKHIHVTDDALRPKSFNIRIEDGNFALPEDVLYNGPNVETPYTKRLVFDKSPYPPESEWKESWLEDWKESEGTNYWDEKEFVNDNTSFEEWSAKNKSIGLKDYDKFMATLVKPGDS
jgi:hypothetical protein